VIRAEERMLERNAACPEGNMQLRGGSYGGRRGQIMQRWGDNKGGYRGGGNTFNRGGNQSGLRRDPNTMDVDRGRGGGQKVLSMWKVWPYGLKLLGKE